MIYLLKMLKEFLKSTTFVSYIIDIIQSKKELMAKIEKLQDELETERMKLVACSTASMQNTRKSINERIGSDNPYWSASYVDVCRTVDKEIRYREDLNEEIKDIDNILTLLKMKPDDFRTDTGRLHMPKIIYALSDIVKPGIIE